MESNKKYFQAVVRGQYHALSEVAGVPTLKAYEETFILPSQEAALSNICRFLLTPRLRQKHADFIRYRTHQLVSLTLHGHTPDPDVLQMSIDDMSLEQLYDFCILKQLMVDPYKHTAKDIFQIRELVSSVYTQKREMAKSNQMMGSAEEKKSIAALREANALPVESEGLHINVNELKASREKKAAEPLGPSGMGAGEPVEPEDAPLPTDTIE